MQHATPVAMKGVAVCATASLIRVGSRIIIVPIISISPQARTIIANQFLSSVPRPLVKYSLQVQEDIVDGIFGSRVGCS